MKNYWTIKRQPYESLAAYLKRVGALLALPVALTACGGSRPPLPLPPPPAVEVMVPVPVPCQIEKVPVPAYPNKPSADATVFELARTALADRRVRMAENQRLRAANGGGCK